MENAHSHGTDDFAVFAKKAAYGADDLFDCGLRIADCGLRTPMSTALRLAGGFLDFCGQVGGVEAEAGFPFSETSVIVDGFYPFGQKAPFCLIFGSLLAFGFQNQICAVGQTDEVVGAVFMENAGENVGDLKAKVSWLLAG